MGWLIDGMRPERRPLKLLPSGLGSITSAKGLCYYQATRAFELLADALDESVLLFHRRIGIHRVRVVL